MTRAEKELKMEGEIRNCIRGNLYVEWWIFFGRNLPFYKVLENQCGFLQQVENFFDAVVTPIVDNGNMEISGYLRERSI